LEGRDPEAVKKGMKGKLFRGVRQHPANKQAEQRCSGPTSFAPEEKMLFQLRGRHQAERMQLAANPAASSHGRGMAGIDKGLGPETFSQVPNVRVGAACATRQIYFADQEAALQFTSARSVASYFDVAPSLAPRRSSRVGCAG
jgi:hypothetical protein